MKNENEFTQKLQNSLEKIKNAENILFNFWDEQDSFKHLIKQIKFSDSLNILNNCENVLLVKGLFHYSDLFMGFGLKSLTSLALVSYGVFNTTNLTDIPERLKKWCNDNFKMGTGPTAGYFADFIWKGDNKIVHSIFPVILGIYCATTLKKDFDNIHGSLLFQYYLHMFTNHLAQVTQGMKNIYESIKMYDEFLNFKEFKALKDFYEKEVEVNKELQDLLMILKTPTFNGRNVLLSHHGAIIKAYSLMHKLKEKFEQALVAVARIDAYFSISKLIKEKEDKNINFCFPEYVQSDKPFIKIDNFWHPLVDEEKVVTNSITLGIDNFKPNVVITGPNEGGKSTVLKSITLCLILAQTIGISPAQSMRFTPFQSITTYLNITDDIGSGNSLFKAEVLRAQELIERITNFKLDEFNFCVFDEIFNGTSPLEGSAAAYGVTKHLSYLQNSICMISTHFPLLTKLENDTDTFDNYKVSVEQNADGSISYPYKLEMGISNQNVALDILRNQGFSSKIIEEAQKIKNTLI